MQLAKEAYVHPYNKRLHRQVKFEASWQREEKSTRKPQVLKYSIGKGLKKFSPEE
jgi:hypothetical protein